MRRIIQKEKLLGLIYGWVDARSDGKYVVGNSGQSARWGARGGSKPSPWAAAQPRVSLLQHCPLISTQLAWSSICCLESHSQPHTHTYARTRTHKQKNTNAFPPDTFYFHYPILSEKISDSVAQLPTNCILISKRLIHSVWKVQP